MKAGRALTLQEAKDFLAANKASVISVFDRLGKNESRQSIKPPPEDVQLSRANDMNRFRALMTDRLFAVLPQDATWLALSHRLRSATQATPAWTWRGEEVKVEAKQDPKLQELLTALANEEKGGQLNAQQASQFVQRYKDELGKLLARANKPRMPTPDFHDKVLDLVNSRLRMRFYSTVGGQPTSALSTMHKSLLADTYKIVPDDPAQLQDALLANALPRPPQRAAPMSSTDRLQALSAILEAEEKKAGGRLNLQQASAFFDTHKDEIRTLATAMYSRPDRTNDGLFQDLLVNRLRVQVPPNITWAGVQSQMTRGTLRPSIGQQEAMLQNVMQQPQQPQSSSAQQQDAMLQSVMQTQSEQSIGRLPSMQDVSPSKRFFNYSQATELPESPMHSGLPAPEFHQRDTFLYPDESASSLYGDDDDASFFAPEETKVTAKGQKGPVLSLLSGSKRSSSLEEARNYEQKLQNDLKLLIAATNSNSSSSSPAQMLNAQVELERQIADAQAAVAQEELFAEESPAKRRKIERKKDDDDQDFLT